MMKKGLIITIILLGIMIIFSSVILYKRYQDNKIIDGNNIKEEVKVSSLRKEKEKELERVIEENKDKIERYKKIESWNEEIIEYLE